MSWERNNAEIQGFERGVRELFSDIAEEIEAKQPEDLKDLLEILEDLRVTYLGEE